MELLCYKFFVLKYFLSQWVEELSTKNTEPIAKKIAKAIECAKETRYTTIYVYYIDMMTLIYHFRILTKSYGGGGGGELPLGKN